MIVTIALLAGFNNFAAGFANGQLGIGQLANGQMIDQWEGTSHQALNVRYAAWVKNQQIVCKVDFMQHPELAPHFGAVTDSISITENMANQKSESMTHSNSSLIHAMDVPVCKGEQLNRITQVAENSYFHGSGYIHKTNWRDSTFSCVTGVLIDIYLNVIEIDSSTKVEVTVLGGVLAGIINYATAEEVEEEAEEKTSHTKDTKNQATESKKLPYRRQNQILTATKYMDYMDNALNVGNHIIKGVTTVLTCAAVTETGMRIIFSE